MSPDDVVTVYLLGLVTIPAVGMVADAVAGVWRWWRPERVRCAGCGEPGGVTVVTDPGQAAAGMDGVFAWHRACLDAATVTLPGAFTGTWDVLDEQLPEPIGGAR